MHGPNLQAEIDIIVADLLTRSRIADPSTVHVEVRPEAAVDAYTYVFRRPGWDALLAEAGVGEGWDIEPEAHIVVTTGLLALLSPAQARGVLGHEIAHVEAGDHLRPLPEGGARRAMERATDARAMEISGQGPSLACALLRILRDPGPETDAHRLSHGSVSSRVDAIGGIMAADLEL